jgi:hypothetical protein
MTAVQIKALSDSQVKGLSAQVANMTKTQVGGLESVDFAIIGSGLFNSEQVSALSAIQKKAYLDAGGTIGVTSK